MDFLLWPLRALSSTGLGPAAGVLAGDCIPSGPSPGGGPRRTCKPPFSLAVLWHGWSGAVRGGFLGAGGALRHDPRADGSVSFPPAEPRIQYRFIKYTVPLFPLCAWVSVSLGICVACPVGAGSVGSRLNPRAVLSTVGDPPRAGSPAPLVTGQSGACVRQAAPWGAEVARVGRAGAGVRGLWPVSPSSFTSFHLGIWACPPGGVEASLQMEPGVCAEQPRWLGPGESRSPVAAVADWPSLGSGRKCEVGLGGASWSRGSGWTHGASGSGCGGELLLPLTPAPLSPVTPTLTPRAAGPDLTLCHMPLWLGVPLLGTLGPCSNSCSPLSGKFPRTTVPHVFLPWVAVPRRAGPRLGSWPQFPGERGAASLMLPVAFRRRPQGRALLVGR